MRKNVTRMDNAEKGQVGEGEMERERERLRGREGEGARVRDCEGKRVGVIENVRKRQWGAGQMEREKKREREEEWERDCEEEKKWVGGNVGKGQQGGVDDNLMVTVWVSAWNGMSAFDAECAPSPQVLRFVTWCCSVLQCVAVCCSVLQCVAVCCSVLQCVVVCCSVCSVL